MNIAGAILIYGVAIFGFAFVYRRLTQRLQARYEQKDYERLKQDQPERVFGTPEYRDRFDNPDFASLEAHLQRPLPRRLKELYADSATVRAGTEVRLPEDAASPASERRVLNFFPADAAAINDLWPVEELEIHQIPFAADLTGRLYYLDLQSGDPQDPPVYASTLEENQAVAGSLSEFLSWCGGAASDGSDSAAITETVPASDPQ